MWMYVHNYLHQKAIKLYGHKAALWSQYNNIQEERQVEMKGRVGKLL